MNPKILCLALASVLALYSNSASAAAAKAPLKPPAAGKAEATKVPDSAYGVYTMDEANAEAAKKKKPITYLITDQRPDEPAVIKGTNKAFWMLRDDTVVVVLRNSTAAEWPKRLPEGALKFLKATELGKEYPKLVVMSEDSTVALAGMNAGKIIEAEEKDLDKFGKEIKKLNVSKEASSEFPPPNPDVPKPAAAPKAAAKTATKSDAPPAPATPAAPAAPAAPAVPAGPVTIKNPQQEAWTNSEGKAIQAALVEVDGEAITFDIGGNKVPYELSKLSEPSKKRVAELSAANSK